MLIRSKGQNTIGHRLNSDEFVNATYSRFCSVRAPVSQDRASYGETARIMYILVRAIYFRKYEQT